ncbi:hypothetical protein GCM10010873_23400 [Cypionkella aquatica]|uniref:Hedgehog/Intein (Hint) domain-containing protein n=1 Tax=Cypionkella aquatica TaxID=1756042 RepID=A0AA37X498_9RHOB|nr:Hint domain-containing protein [Cypionkella aquatica]GLS87366.1 hypothetical protein GCM10010873_23400 [Cypionkella aquatica]
MTIHSKMQAAQAAVGLDHGLAAGTEVLTLDGFLPVEYLTPGDRVICRTGALKLKAIEVTLVQNLRVVRILQDVLGVDCPARVMTVTPDQPILIRDWRARALAGSAVALIAAERLVDGAYIRVEQIAELRMFTLRFDEDVVIYAGGLELACTAANVTA